jgi:hypothetical protein
MHLHDAPLEVGEDLHLKPDPSLAGNLRPKHVALAVHADRQRQVALDSSARQLRERPPGPRTSSRSRAKANSSSGQRLHLGRELPLETIEPGRTVSPIRVSSNRQGWSMTWISSRSMPTGAGTLSVDDPLIALRRRRTVRRRGR